jgi:hypothetical protein
MENLENENGIHQIRETRHYIVFHGFFFQKGSNAKH